MATSPVPAAQSKKHHAAAPAAPAAPAAHPLGSFDGWSAYTSEDKTGKVCYLVGEAQKSEPASATRKPPSAMVTHRPVEKIANVVSFVEGYTLKNGSDVALTVDGTKFELFTKDDSAWARTSDLDRVIVATLAKGRQAVVKGVPQKGPATTDTYSLAGFSKALAAIDKACGVTREETAAPPAPPPTPTPHKRHKHPASKS
ncbi:MAG TPA: invasion associated locus B family protein [Stellaceae bacterium]|nr:invasion associated locus B family protein [Stellaceae bacterium]